MRPLLAGVLQQHWVDTSAACTVVDTLVKELGLKLLETLPGKQLSTDQSGWDPAWTAAELALTSPAVLKHMVVKLGLNANARLVGDKNCDGGTLLHRVFFEIRPQNDAPLVEACAESLGVLLDAGADPDRCNSRGVTPMELAILFQASHCERMRSESPAARSCIRALLSKTVAPSFYAGIRDDELSKVPTPVP